MHSIHIANTDIFANRLKNAWSPAQTRIMIHYFAEIKDNHYRCLMKLPVHKNMKQRRLED